MAASWESSCWSPRDVVRRAGPVPFARSFAQAATLPRNFANATTGFMVEQIGWEHFFYLCTLLALPGMALLLVVAPWNGVREPEPKQQTALKDF